MKTYVAYRGVIKLLDEGNALVSGTTIYSLNARELKIKSNSYPMVELVLKSEAEAEIEKLKAQIKEQL